MLTAHFIFLFEAVQHIKIAVPQLDDVG